jgi:uncharacterized protein (TIGR00299 family) protein
MKIAYLDTIAGISGDMTLGAFVSAGVPFDALVAEIGKLGLKGVELSPSRVVRHGISAMKIDVVISAPDAKHRHLKNILHLIEGSGLDTRVADTAKRIFAEVAAAEAKIHDTTIEKVHFHEVGALDSIVDIVGAAVCLDLSGVEAVYTSPVKLGSGGTVGAEHGNLPVPGPAAMEILRNYPTVLTDIPFELTTPTGAAIVKATSSGVLARERFTVNQVGYGAGSREMTQIPNVLRVMIGELQTGDGGEVCVVESNIDDMNPELYPYVMEKIFEAGALDAWITPVTMKKGRPGSMISALATQVTLDRVTGVFLSQTTTIGVRISDVRRVTLERSSLTVKTVFGQVRAKEILRDGRTHIIPEFEECRRIAGERGIPLIDVYRTLDAELEAVARTR